MHPSFPNPFCLHLTECCSVLWQHGTLGSVPSLPVAWFCFKMLCSKAKMDVQIFIVKVTLDWRKYASMIYLLFNWLTWSSPLQICFSCFFRLMPFFSSSSPLCLLLILLPLLPFRFFPLIRSLSQGSTNSNMLDVQGGAHKKRVRRSSLLNAKKLYEDAQMARKVKQYLSNLTVEIDEEKHQIMSLQCEPSYNAREWHNHSFCWAETRRSAWKNQHER